MVTEECTTKVSELVDIHQDYLPSSHCFTSELHCWMMKWQQHLKEHGRSTLPSIPTAALRHASSDIDSHRGGLVLLYTGDH